MRRRLFQDGLSLCAPSLLRLESLNVLRRLLLSKIVSEPTAHLAFADLMRLGIHYYSEEALVRRVWNLRHNLTAYDAAYVALAESLEAPLLTRDDRLAKSSGHRARIEFIPLTSSAA